MIRALAAAALLAAACAGPRAMSVGQPLDLSLPRLDGGAFSFADLRGQVVLVDVWASWCRPCVQSLPFYADLETALAPKGFKVVGINVDADERAAEAFLRAESLELTTLADPGADEVERRFGVRLMPTAFLLDRRGRIRFVHEGFHPRDRQILRERVEALLAEK